jgi:hypothetical protein
MSQTYTQRRATVEKVLEQENIKLGKGKNLTDLASSVLSALDHIKETVR